MAKRTCADHKINIYIKRTEKIIYVKESKNYVKNITEMMEKYVLLGIC